MSTIDVLTYALSMIAVLIFLRGMSKQTQRVSTNEGGFAVILVILALFVVVIMVIMPALQTHGNMNPGCLVVKTVSCK